MRFGVARSQDEARRLREAWTTGYKRDAVRRDATRTPPVLDRGSYSSDDLARHLILAVVVDRRTREAVTVDLEGSKFFRHRKLVSFSLSCPPVSCVFPLRLPDVRLDIFDRTSARCSPSQPRRWSFCSSSPARFTPRERQSATTATISNR